MKRTWVILGLAMLILGQTGCTACKKMFGMDRRCEEPPPQVYGPVSYAPAPNTCTAPK